MPDQKYSKVTKTPLVGLFFQINGMIVATLSHDQMIEFLRKPGSVSAVIVPPFQNGKPRKYVSVMSESSRFATRVFLLARFVTNLR